MTEARTLDSRHIGSRTCRSLLGAGQTGPGRMRGGRRAKEHRRACNTMMRNPSRPGKGRQVISGSSSISGAGSGHLWLSGVIA